MNKLVFLGTSASIPTKTRNLPAIYLKYKNYDILFDCGEGTQRQMIFSKLSPMKTDIICITHNHADHYLGIYGMIQTMQLLGREKPLTIITPFETGLKNSKLSFEINEIIIKKETTFDFKDFQITAFKVKHIESSYGFVFKEKDTYNLIKEKLKEVGLYNSPLCKKLKEDGKITINNKTIYLEEVAKLKKGIKITYSGDTMFCENLIKHAKDSDLLIHDSTFIEKDLAEDMNHSCVKDACLSAKLSNSKKLILTHISPRYEKTPELIIEEAKKYFNNTILAHDFMEVSLRS